jgi:hypothetical protein
MQLPVLTLPAFPHISASLFINPTVLIFVLVAFCFLYILVSSVLMYHWSAYGMGSPGILVGETLFIFISVILFVISGLSIYYF